MGYRAAVLTVSDRSARGERADGTGPVTADLLEAAGFTVTAREIAADDRDAIEAALRRLAKAAELVVTAGGTGLSPRDVTPEATLAVCERLVPGIPEAMRAASMQITPRAMLSRAQAGILGRTLIINLPGSPKAARENLEAVLPALAHALAVVTGGVGDCG